MSQDLAAADRVPGFNIPGQKNYFPSASFLATVAALEEPKSETTDEVLDEEHAEAVEPEPTVEEPAETEVLNENGLDQELLDHAADHGISSEEAAEFGDLLPKYLASLDRQGAQLMRDRQGAPAHKAEAQPAPIEKEAPKSQPQIDVAKIFEPIKLDLDPDDYDEKTIAAFRTFEDQINEQKKIMSATLDTVLELNSGLNQVKTHAQTKSEGDVASQLDKAFESMDAERYGKGPIHTLMPGSTVVAERQKIVEEAAIQRDLLQAKGRPIPSWEILLRRAEAVIDPDAAKKSAVGAVRQQVATQRKSAIAKPGGRIARSGTPRENALANIAEKLAKMGLN